MVCKMVVQKMKRVEVSMENLSLESAGTFRPVPFGCRCNQILALTRSLPMFLPWKMSKRACGAFVCEGKDCKHEPMSARQSGSSRAYVGYSLSLPPRRHHGWCLDSIHTHRATLDDVVLARELARRDPLLDLLKGLWPARLVCGHDEAFQAHLLLDEVCDVLDGIRFIRVVLADAAAECDAAEGAHHAQVQIQLLAADVLKDGWGERDAREPMHVS